MTATQPEGLDMTDELKPGHCHKCGLQLSDNPHPEAGKPAHYLKVGCPKECIPCLTLSRHQWAGRAMKAENELADARALLSASKPAAPWIAHWAGSNPYKGWSIRQGRDEVIWFGETISSETVESIVLAHNKCFDCEGSGCVMNCSGLSPAAPAQSADLAAQEAGFADFQSALNWIAGHQCNCCEPSPTAVVLDDERAAFERHWYNFYHSGSIKARSDGRYMQPVVQHAWEAWQARAASPQPVAPLVEQTRALTDAQIKDAVDAIDFSTMVTADDFIYVIARAVLTAARPASGETET